MPSIGHGCRLQDQSLRSREIKSLREGAFSTNGEVIKQKTLELSEWLWITLLHTSAVLRAAWGRTVATIYGQREASSHRKGSLSQSRCACPNCQPWRADTRQAVPGAPQTKARLDQAGTDQLISFFHFSFCLHVQFNPFQCQSFSVSLSQPTALGPTSPSLQLLAALFQNPVGLKGQHSIFLREKLNGRGEGCRVSMGLGSLGANKWRGSSPCCGTHCIFHSPAIPSQWYSVQRVIPSEVHPHSSLQHYLLSKPSPKPRGGAQSCAPPGCPGGVGLHNHRAMPGKMPASCLSLHTLQRQLCSDGGFPVHFIFMHAHQLHVHCQQLSQGCWQGSQGEGLMLHWALPLSPSGAGLEDMAAMHGDASQLQRATSCSPSWEEPGKVTLSSTWSPSNTAC